MTIAGTLTVFGAIIVILIIVFFWSRVEGKYYRGKLRRISMRRKSYNLGRFESYFEAEGIPEDICEVVYMTLPQFCVGGIRDFPVKPDDDLEELYRIGRMGGLTIDLALLEMGKKLNLPLPEDSIVAEIWHEISWTGKAQDVVRYFHVLRKRNAKRQAVNAN